MILSDRTIREELETGGIVIEPLGENAIQPSSVDLHVDHLFRVFRNDTTPYIDPKRPQDDLTELVEVEEGEAFILHPGEFVLGSTLERVALGPDLVARLEGKSSLGRLGLLIHSSLPASEPVMLLLDGKLEPRSIGEIVRKRLPGSVVSFDPETFEVGDHRLVRGRPRSDLRGEAGVGAPHPDHRGPQPVHSRRARQAGEAANPGASPWGSSGDP
jgi:dCTP deaminase-like